MCSCGAGHLADAHFPGAVGAAGGAEVHEIDAGDEEDEHRDDGENVYELDIAVDFKLTRFSGMKVYVGKGKDGAPEMTTRFLEVSPRSMEHSLEGRADIAVDDFIYILLYLGSRGAGLGKDICMIRIAYPVVVARVIKAV